MNTLLSTKPVSQNNEAPPLEIRFQFVDGSVASFFQPDPEIAQSILGRINMAHLFSRPRTDLVELSEEDFRALVPLEDPSRLERRAQPRHVGDLLVSFLHLRMRGGSHIYLMNEALVKLPVENHSFMQRLLSGGNYSIRLRCGGHGFLNLSNLVGYTVYPGVPEIPSDSWIALSSALEPAPEQTGEYAYAKP